MKLKKLFFLVLAMIMIVSVLPACTSGEDVTVKLKVVAGDDEIFNRDVTVHVNDENGASVIQVVNEACNDMGLEATLTSDEKGVESFKGIVYDYKPVTVDKTTYSWMYTIDGEMPKSGKAADNYVTAGQVIEYNIFAYDAETDTQELYDSELGIFGENDDEVEEAE